jgi:hypothetical protein
MLRTLGRSYKMTISLYGERYIDSQRFVAYCRSMRADPSLTSHDLELYEKEGFLLPVARVVRPSEYIDLRRAQFNPGGDPGAAIPGWEELEKLLYGSSHDELLHKFDAEFDRLNKYLINPRKTRFQAWGSYRVEVQSSAGETYLTENATHYYHYWQIYQVYELQHKFPIFSKYHYLYEAVKEKMPAWAQNFHPGTPNHLVDLYGYYQRFDALSFFTTLYANEQVKTFLLPGGKIRSLDEKEFAEYLARQKEHAQFAVNEYGLKDRIDSLYEFLKHLLELQSDFQSQEKIQLVNEVEKDLLHLVRFIFFVTGQKFDEIGHMLKPLTDFGMQRQFRHLDRSLLVQDETQEVFQYLLKEYNRLFPNSSLLTQELDQLVNFFFSKPLFIFPYAVYEIQENLNDTKLFPRTSLYISLSNLSVGFESFLRTLVNGDVLYNLIGNLYGRDPAQKNLWLDQFNSYIQNHSGTGTVARLYDVVTDPHLNEIAIMFLAAYYARNFVMHEYTEDSEFFDEVFSKVYTSICYGVFYTWHYALRQGIG